MKNKLFISLAILVVVFTGCKKFLDIKPKGFTIPEFFDDYQKLMNNQDLLRVSSAYPNYLTDDLQAGDVNDVNRNAKYAQLPQFEKNLYEFKNGQVLLDGESDQLYEPAYNHIYTYNTVINNVLNVPDGTESERKRLWSEALLGRAFEYLILVNAYAVHYNPATAAKVLGVPLVLSEDINAKYKRNTVAEVYEQIEKDLNAALPNLATSVPNNFRPQKSVGYAFLSRMYLYMGEYQKALTNANQALALNNYLIDYKLYTTKESTTFGRVCEIANNSVRFPDAQFNKESIWIRLGASSYGSLNGDVYASKDLQTVYNSNLSPGSEDMRFKLFFLNGRAKFGGGAAVLFPGRVLYGPYVEMNIGLSSPELYLIAAECEARVGSKEKAMQWLNTLRDARIANNVHLTAASNDEALLIALQERRREMPFLGCTRLVDLKRLNEDPRFAKTITHTQEANTYTLPAKDKRYVLPLPPNVVDLNPGIPQYER